MSFNKSARIAGLSTKVYNGVKCYWKTRGLKLKPKKWYTRARDAYVRIMMKLANTSVVRSRTMAGYNGDGFGRPSNKEYDDKIIYQIYKTLSVAQHKQHRIPTQVACSV
uniref:Uncharacterized protein n=1 Tax=Tanacetum cinerariifolium TaxID=118510 RepID=A0A699JZI6_TANCI|nr:hypothetical protein [Tanacetum cinerariifolium]